MEMVKNVASTLKLFLLTFYVEKALVCELRTLVYIK